MELHPWIEDLLRSLLARADGDYEIPRAALDKLGINPQNVADHAQRLLAGTT